MTPPPGEPVGRNEPAVSVARLLSVLADIFLWAGAIAVLAMMLHVTADVLMPTVPDSYAQLHPTLLAEYPGVMAWIDRCQARPAFQKMWAGRLAEPA